MYGAHASRVPGLMTLADATVRVPVLADAADVTSGGGSTGDPESDGTSVDTEVRAAATRSLPATGLDAAPLAGALLLTVAVGAALVRRHGRIDDEG
jgi:hypothetical protein